VGTDAGIRVSGNLNISALQVANIQVSGASIGPPTIAALWRRHGNGMLPKSDANGQVASVTIPRRRPPDIGKSPVHAVEL
jgi:hypothetical protein